jgi:hypothetical protein
MRPTIIVLATVAVVLLVVGGVAAGQQQQGSTSSALSPTISTDMSSADITIQSSSTTPKATFTNGSGANFLGVKVSDHGNLLSFESPAGQEALFLSDPLGNEGFLVCSSGLDGPTVHGHDTGNVEGGFGTPTFAQPNGAGTFPLTVTRNTTDGKFQLKQVWAKPDAIEKDVTVTMTLTNRSSSAISNVKLARTGEFDVGPTGQDRGARTRDSVWQWDDSGGGPDSSAPGGLMLTALTFGTAHQGSVESSTEWRNGIPAAAIGPIRTRCEGFAQLTPTGVDDYAMKSVYNLETLNAGQSKTVKFEYGRM